MIVTLLPLGTSPPTPSSKKKSQQECFTYIVQKRKGEGLPLLCLMSQACGVPPQLPKKRLTPGLQNNTESNLSFLSLATLP
jgi:hypothetical protein